MLIVYLVGCLLTYASSRWIVSTIREPEEAERSRRGIPFVTVLWPLVAIGLMGFAIGMIMMALHDFLPDWLKKKGHYDP